MGQEELILTASRKKQLEAELTGPVLAELRDARETTRAA